MKFKIRRNYYIGLFVLGSGLTLGGGGGGGGELVHILVGSVPRKSWNPDSKSDSKNAIFSIPFQTRRNF